MSKKPANLLYGVDDTPPIVITIVLGIQHMCILFMATILPVLIIQQLGDSISAEEAQSFISMTMIAGGISTIIQSFKFGPVGSGYFCPALSGTAYFDASKVAALAGGLPLLFGMTLLSGLIESLFSRFIHKLRFLFPVEVTGLIVAMVGIVILPISIQNFFGINQLDPAMHPHEVLIGVLTISTMIGLNVWSKGNVKLFCTLMGMIFGYILGLILNVIPANDLQRLSSAELFSLPKISHIRWAFDLSLIIPFTVATICSSFKTVGDLVTCQRINDSDWKRPDMKNVSAGIFADGLAGLIPGLIGGYGQSTSSTNVGMSIATSITSRKIAIPLSIIFFVLAFFPKIAEIFIIMPKPVMGATMIFAISFMVTTGFQMMMSRMLDSRRIFIIGVSLVFGLSVDMLPHLYTGVHPWIKPIFGSTLSLATVLAISLNLLFRIGISKKKSIIIFPTDNIAEKIFTFMEDQGGIWGARKDVFDKAKNALSEISEMLLHDEIAKSSLAIHLHFDEYKLKTEIEYIGNLIELKKEKPTDIEIIEEGGMLKLAGFLIYKYADNIKTETKGDKIIITMIFDH